MSVEAHKALARRWAELWNGPADLSVVDEILAPDFVSHSTPPDLPPGPEGIKQWVAGCHRAFPDLYSIVEDLIAENDKVVERYRSGGTHLGDLFGIPPTGRHETTTGINIFRIADGKIVEYWSNSDDLGMLQQLGLIPPV